MNLKELAEQLSLSQTTVSRALNGYPEVSESTRRRVIEAADRLNYRPDTRARSLATGRSMAIGHVIPLSDRHEMVNPIFTDFIAGAGEVYHRNGYHMLLSVVADGEESSAYRDLATRRSVDGLILHAPRANDARIAMLRDIGMPFVVHGRASNEGSGYNWVDVNNRRAFMRATEFLIDLGHRRIGLINGLEAMDFAARRREGYLQALRERGIPADRDLMKSDEMTEGYGFLAMSDLLSLPDAPTAVVASSIILANGVRRALDAKGLVLGRDMSVITYDDDLSYFRNVEDVPLFSAVKSSVREAGRIAAAMLLDIISGSCKEPCTELLEVDLTIGRSTGPAPEFRTAISGS